MRRAPGLCMFPPPPKARLSKSQDGETHGKKLYCLYAKQRNSYLENKADVSDQVVVKEAWLPPTLEAVKAAEEDYRTGKGTTESPILAFKTDVLGPKSGLYIMYNTGLKTPDTDEGWICGTVTSDGNTVTSAGRVQSCMGCHVSAPHGRLFGTQE